LSVDDAIQIALLNNRGLQAAFAELGIAESELVQAGRLKNPGFSFSRATSGDEISIERKLIFNVLSLITIPFALEIEERRYEQAKLRAALDMLQIATETRRAYFAAVAAVELRACLDQVMQAAEASAELSRRMVRAGNWGKLHELREQVFYAEVAAQSARANQMAVSARERLTRLMGRWAGQAAFKLPARLPDLPAQPEATGDIEAKALRERLDIRMARQEIQGLARSLGLTQATRFISVLDIGYLRNSETGKPRETGYEIELQIPIFDWADARIAKAEHVYTQATHRFAETAVNARSEVRESYHAYRTAFDLARHYRDEIVPLRKRISEENLLRYNGMLISVFDLLADARAQMTSVSAYVEAVRDFWIADAELRLAMLGKSMPASGLSARAAAVPASGGEPQH